MVKKLTTPFQNFVRIEGLSGILLFGATIVALIWANSPFAASYEALWQYKIGIETELIKLNKPLILWINDLLMAVFFFLIGLEIKRELLIGELNSPRKAAFPLFAAIGGMIFPVLFYVVLNTNPETMRGWGIPMATDIAFTLAILNLLGKRVPISVKVFLTAFAIVDDIGAVLVIAIFYSGDLNVQMLLIAAGILSFLYVLGYFKIYSKYLYFLAGAVVWYCFLKAGIHPTVAGVLLAFSIPIAQKIDSTTFASELKRISTNIEEDCDEKSPILSKEVIMHIDELETWTEKVQSPLQHLEHNLHSWVAFFIIPIFALSNAGVPISGSMDLDLNLVLKIALALIIAKVVGVTLLSYVGIWLGVAELPGDITRRHIIGVGFLAGVGFTMSIFIANLAFGASPAYIDSAKIGILSGSLVAGIIGYLVLRSTAVVEAPKET